ncbi:MAG: Ribose import ATP-binding protein RbsA [Pseudomonas citronellolis]|nr:MAG: Ribose import ATP-binding protein RbsA [Pseudomonas citronellolis]
MSSVPPPASAFLQLQGLGKSFGSTAVLQGIDLDIRPGEVLALLGANGAGKSTLVKVLAGLHRHDRGRLLIDGREQCFDSPLAARRAGIIAVHQQVEQGIVPGLSVAENLLLDQLCDSHGRIGFRPAEARRLAARIAAALDLDLPLTQPIERLGSAEQQLVILARALASRPRLLILDEPTAALSSQESERLFGLIERLRQQGVAILYISHRLSDLQRLAERAVVLRDGRLAGVFEAPLALDAALEAMLGAPLDTLLPEPSQPGATRLSLRQWQLFAHSQPFDLDLRDGEVVAVTGLLGAGKSELAESLFGLRRPVAGQLTLDGVRWAPRSPREAIAAGVFFAAEDRRRGSLVPGYSLRQTLTLPWLHRFSRAGFIDRASECAAAQAQIAALGILGPGQDAPMEQLSGGNQQKVILARWLLGEGRVLILDEPFQGVDVRARREIGRHIRRSAAGRATLVICADPDEALEIADRIVLMRDATLVGDLPREGLVRAVILEGLAARPAANPSPLASPGALRG